MTFRWLPDAELDPHPCRTWIGACCFDLVVTALYRLRLIYPPDYQLVPGMLVVSNHRRDADVPLLASALCQRKGLRLRWPLPFWASREDLFHRGFLREYLHTWPRPLRIAVGWIPLARLLYAMRVEPLRRVREFTLAEAFADLAATDDGMHCLNRRGRQELSASDAALGAAANSPMHRVWGLRRLHGSARATLAPGFRATIDAQLARFADLLDAGRIVYFAPEGTVSQDGRFGRLRAGTWLLVQRTTAQPPILPVALSYDALQAGRLRAIIHVGTPMTAYCAHDRRRFDGMLEKQIRRLYPLNASHLASRYLVAGPATFTRAELACWFAHAREWLAAAGCMLDPHLARADADVLAGRRLGWLRRQQLVTRTQAGWRNCWPRAARAGWHSAAATVRYYDNALQDHLQALSAGLELRP